MFHLLCLWVQQAIQKSLKPQANLLFGNSVYTLDDTVELERAEVGISDVPITQKILDNCIATSTDENGKETVLEVKATIRDLGTVTRVLPMKIVVIYTH